METMEARTLLRFLPWESLLVLAAFGIALLAHLRTGVEPPGALGVLLALTGPALAVGMATLGLRDRYRRASTDPELPSVARDALLRERRTLPVVLASGLVLAAVSGACAAWLRPRIPGGTHHEALVTTLVLLPLWWLVATGSLVRPASLVVVATGTLVAFSLGLLIGALDPPSIGSLTADQTQRVLGIHDEFLGILGVHLLVVLLTCVPWLALRHARLLHHGVQRRLPMWTAPAFALAGCLGMVGWHLAAPA
jgi:hypothetical protein